LGFRGTRTIQTSGEFSSLGASLNDLMAVLTLPALWNGRGQEHVLTTLLDAIRRILELDFAYAHLSLPGGVPIEIIRVVDQGNLKNECDGLCQVIRQWLQNDPEARSHILGGLDDDSNFSVATFRLGPDERMDALVAGSRRSGFPNKSEKLLLDVAANQAAIGLREARFLEEQRRVAQELEVQISQRDGQLVIASDELKKENEQRQAAERALQLLETSLSEAARLAAAAEHARTSELAGLKEKYAQLTPREKEVLPFVIAGQLSKQTAGELGTSEITIRVHRGRIMRKMQAQSLAELIRMADKLGIH
jgi:DNA-binding CsgD family transcriptional regulator